MFHVYHLYYQLLPMVSQIVNGWGSGGSVEQCRLAKQHAVSLVLSTAAQQVSQVVSGGLVEQCRWIVQLFKQNDVQLVCNLNPFYHVDKMSQMLCYDWLLKQAVHCSVDHLLFLART